MSDRSRTISYNLTWMYLKIFKVHIFIYYFIVIDLYKFYFGLLCNKQIGGWVRLLCHGVHDNHYLNWY